MTQILPQAKPGDLITAADWNALIDTVNAALIRIAALEAGSQPGTGLAITQLVPDGPVRVGDTLRVIGRNFQFSIGATRVFINATPVMSLLPTSTDSRLEFVIPGVPGVSEAGTPADLVVLNQTESTSRQITLRPRLSALQGNVTVEYQSADPATIMPDQPATFAYRIRSGTNNRATWTITPQISVAAGAAAWNAQLSVLDASGSVIASRQIALDPDEQRNFFVRIGAVPAGTDGVEFGLVVNALADGISGSSGTRKFTVGTADIPPDPSITLALQPAASLPPGALTGSTLTVAAGGSSTLAIAATFTVAGTYTLTLNVLAGATGWTATRIPGTPETYIVTSADLAASGQIQSLVRLAVAATAAATPTAQLEVRLQRSGQTAFRSLIVTLVRS